MRPSCSGMAKTKRFSSPGIGTVSAATGLPRAAASNTRCVPRLGRSRNPGSISPAHTPVALITARAVTSNDSPPRISVSRADVAVTSEAPT